MARLTAQQIAWYAQQAGFPSEEIARATAVALAESGGDPAATHTNTNRSVDYGLWQINSVHGGLLNQGDKFNPLDNAKMAHTVWQGAGGKWTPWSAYNNGSSQGFIAQATLAAAKPVPPASPAGASATAGATASGAPAEAGGTTQGSAPAVTPNPIAEALSPITGLIDKVKTLFNVNFWWRLGCGILGAVMILASVVMVTGQSSTVQGAVKLVATKGIPL
jgi:hypothetical protein